MGIYMFIYLPGSHIIEICKWFRIRLEHY